MAIAALIISGAVLIHGLLNWYSLLDHEARHKRNQEALQMAHHAHEIKFARMQHDLFQQAKKEIH